MYTGKDKQIKIIKQYLLKTPFALLILAEKSSGPAFLCAVLSIVHEKTVIDSVGHPVTMVFHDKSSDKWGRYANDNSKDQPEDEKIWYELLTKEEKTMDDLVHFCSSSDLQKLINIPTTTLDANDIVVDEKGESYLAAFKSDFPILFECLEAVFGLMMSNSRLCEQVHGMCHGLRSSVGMDQADHQRMYMMSTGYSMNEERRVLTTTSTEDCRKRYKKAAKHSATKPQQVKLGEQVVNRSCSHSLIVSSLGELADLPSVSQINTVERRTHDKANLEKQIEAGNERASLGLHVYL